MDNQNKVYTFGEPAGTKFLKPIQYIITEKGCFNCISHRLDQDGYPKVERKRKEWRMNRYIYTIMFGEIPEGMVVRHKCDNPTCINPAHLELGTIQDNNYDKILRGRQNKGDHRLSKEIIKAIKQDNSCSAMQLSKKYNISYHTVRKIKRGETHNNIHPEVNRTRRKIIFSKSTVISPVLFSPAGSVPYIN